MIFRRRRTQKAQSPAQIAEQYLAFLKHHRVSKDICTGRLWTATHKCTGGEQPSLFGPRLCSVVQEACASEAHQRLVAQLLSFEGAVEAAAGTLGADVLKADREVVLELFASTLPYLQRLAALRESTNALYPLTSVEEEAQLHAWRIEEDEIAALVATARSTINTLAGKIEQARTAAENAVAAAERIERLNASQVAVNSASVETAAVLAEALKVRAQSYSSWALGLEEDITSLEASSRRALTR